MENKPINRTDRILSSLDGIQRSAAPGFFYTRLTGRMQIELEAKRNGFVLLRPAFITASLVLALVINFVSLDHLKNQIVQNDTDQSGKPATIESFAEAYQMNATTVYE